MASKVYTKTPAGRHGASRDSEEGSLTINSTHLEATLDLGGTTLLPLGTLTMVSVSSHRETFPVTTLGHTGPIGFTRGHRLYAGTLVFSVFDRSAFTNALDPLEAPAGYTQASDVTARAGRKGALLDMKADELPPFDIHMVYTTPNGVQCYEGLRGVYVVDAGSVRSVDLLQINESYSYMALDHIPIQRLSDWRAGAARQTPPTKPLFAPTAGLTPLP